MEPPSRSPGSPVVIREIWDGRVWAAYPAIMVEESAGQRIFWIAPETRWMAAAEEAGTLLRLPTDHWRLAERRWENRSILSFSWRGVPFGVLGLWTVEPEEFTGWYVNLESPLEPSPVGFDCTDHVLDVLVSADGSSWTWKDEDELAEAVASGLFSEEEARRFYEDGERAVARIQHRQPPFDRDWSTWRPDPSWPVPELGPGWDVV